MAQVLFMTGIAIEGNRETWDQVRCCGPVKMMHILICLSFSERTLTSSV